jgi:hypothetical protein
MPATMPAVHQQTRVEVSRIAGDGLFATAPLAKGAIVVWYRGDDGPTIDLGPVNHSCDPNLGWADEFTLVAMRDLVPGEELTTDYSLSTDDSTYLLRCHCETYRCRGLVDGDDWHIPQLQQRYAGFWTPLLARRIAESTESPRPPSR